MRRWLDRVGRPRRNRGAIFLMLAAVLGGFVVSRAAAAASCTDTYTTSVPTGDWSTATNWSAGIPTASDVACWGAAQTVTVSAAGETAGSVQGGVLSIAGGSLNLASGTGASSVTGLSITEGTLDGAIGAALSVAGNFDWNTASGKTSTINGQGALDITQTGAHTFKIEGSGAELISAGSLSTPNAVSVSDTHLSPGNIPGPSLESDSTITLATGTYDGGNFSMTAAGIITGGAVSTQYSLDLTGSSSTLGGNLTLAALSSDAGTTLTVPSGDAVTAGGGTISGTVTGGGTFDQDGRATTLASGASLTTGAVSATNGQLVVSSGATYTTRATTITGTGGIGVDDNGASTGPLTITGTSSDLYGTGKLTVAGDFDWNIPAGGNSGINVRNPISLTVAQAGTHNFTIEGSGTEAMSGGAITTPNPVTISNTHLSPGNIPGPTLTTTSTVSFTSAGTYSGGNFAVTAAGINTAVGSTTLPYSLNLTGGTTPIATGNTLTASTVNQSGGTLQVDGTLTSPVDLSGGTLKGSGTVSGAVDNSGGTVAPGDSPGKLAVSGNYTQGPGGTLAEEISGTTAGTQFDQLQVDGAASLDGNLAVSSATFTPAPSDAFKIISGASARSGLFAHITGANVNDVTYVERDDSDGVTLTVSAPPPPGNTSPPTISGSPNPGQTLICQNGVWTNNPTHFDYQWNRDGTAIGGAVGDSYTVQLGDQGDALTCAVTASNGGGHGAAVASSAVNVPPPNQPPPKNAPVNTSPPTIRGTPLIGQNVICDHGAWDHSPSGFAFQWNRNGIPIPGATGDTITVPPLDADDINGVADEDDFLTCTVVASNGDGASGPATSAPVNMIAPSPALRPVNTSPPAISGTPFPSQHLLCSPGHWSQTPTQFAFQWTRDGHVIAPANRGSYTVTVADRGHSLACTVTARNVAGASAPATSGAVAVAQPRTLQCPHPSGFMHSQSLGPLTLDLTRHQARSKLPLRTTKPNGLDDFCLFGGWDIEAGYPSRQLLNTVSGRTAKKLDKRVVILLTTNPFYALGGVQPGVTLQSVRNFLHPRVPERIGSSGWYFVRHAVAIQIFEVSNGVVQQAGLADDRLTTTRAARQRLIDSFHL